MTAILKPLQNDEALTPFRAAVAEIYSDRVERIMLFGSRTHGGAKPDFDYDRCAGFSGIDKIIPSVES